MDKIGKGNDIYKRGCNADEKLDGEKIEYIP